MQVLSEASIIIMYQNDYCIDIMFQVAGKDYAKFWCATTAPLPLFHEKADSPAMIKHGMDIV